MGGLDVLAVRGAASACSVVGRRMHWLLRTLAVIIATDRYTLEGVLLVMGARAADLACIEDGRRGLEGSAKPVTLGLSLTASSSLGPTQRLTLAGGTQPAGLATYSRHSLVSPSSAMTGTMA